MRLRREEETTRRLGGVGDNWHMTWTGDGSQIASLCDGRGWPELPGYTGADYNTRLYRIHGDPPAVRFEHLASYPDLLSESHPLVNRYYGFGVVAFDDTVIHFLSTPNHPFSQAGARFAGVKQIHSPDGGATWRNADGSPVRWEPWAERDRENMFFFQEEGEAFSLITVCQMGRGYEANRDGYLYLFAPNGNVEGTMNQLVLCRIPKDRATDRRAATFFRRRGGDGDAEWSPDIEERGIVLEFPAGWVNTKIHPYSWHPSVAYIPALDRYLMANWGMGCSPDGMWFGKPSYLGFWTAPQPWGPWEQIHEETAWMPEGDAGARAYQPQIAPRWIAPDGRSFWMVWTDFQEKDGGRPYYAFNVQKVMIV